MSQVRGDTGGGLFHGKMGHRRGLVTRKEGTQEGVCPTVRGDTGGGLSHGKRGHKRGHRRGLSHDERGHRRVFVQQ